MSHQQHEWLALPVSIAVAGTLIGAGIWLGAESISRGISGGGETKVVEAPTPSAVANAGDKKDITVGAVTSADHIRGSRNAKVIIFEYSDLECPFCKKFHSTIKAVTSKYSGNDVAWVYRHFPLDALHSKARKEAEATECAAELGGNDAFWKYTDRLFEVSPTNNGLDLNELPNIAEYVGLNKQKFSDCLSSGRHAAKVEAQYQSGIKAGAQGTPYSVIVTKTGNSPLGGAVPEAVLEAEIQKALGK